ncbi:MAG: hypothetical protein AMDU5_GPLC00010G0178 [Thermoplasmatales archaeon Gpl]|nr:MAG: hypothetical protein AMDU5_GPLC00010G0178 [Thermoplasmatales archaeon Gpl]
MKPVIKEDKAVSEIIGAILLFAIASVLLTSFILWYVPSTGTNNDLSYQSSTQNAFSSLDSKMINPSVTPGSGISQSFSLGISGTPPFTPSQSTNLYYSNNFNANLSYGMNVNYTNIVTKKTVSMAACANASVSNILDNNYVSSQFKYSVNFQETGLPPGYYWTVTLGGVQESGSPVSSHYADIISFSLSRGTYSYTISTNNETDRASPAGGTVKITNQGVTVPVQFTSEINSVGMSIVAAAYGPTKDANAINTANFVRVVTQPNVCDITYPNYWLNNSAHHFYGTKVNYYPLASQQFFVYQTDTPISYVKFYLEPNIVYYEQEYQGNAGVLVSISHSPFGKGVENGNTSILVEPSGRRTESFTSSNILENLSFPNSGPVLNPTGKTTTYYLNFFEAVNESKNNKTSTGDGSLIFQNKLKGYGYGPNEFIGTITNPSISVNTGVSYYYEATVDAFCSGGNFFSSGSTYFHLSSEQSIESYSSYYFLLGYNVPKTTNNGALIIHESGINTTYLAHSQKSWRFYLGTKCYTSQTHWINITGLPYIQYNYTVPNFEKNISNPEDGFISIVSTKTITYLNVSFFAPVGSLPNFWAISDSGTQQFTLAKSAKINFVTLYLYNFTIPPGYESGNTPTNYISLEIYNKTGEAIVTVDKKILHTGWEQIFLTSSIDGHKPIKFGKGTYNITVRDVNSAGQISFSGEVGWGFAMTGGYSNYLQRVESDSMTSALNISKNSVLTSYGSNSPKTYDVSNQSFIFGVGYYNVTVSREIVSYNVSGDFHIVGSLNSKGVTQFTISETQVLQDGIILTAGKGVTYVTVNPLPIRIVDSSKGISLSSIAYNMSMSKGVSTSVSGVGSTIVSMIMTKSTLVNYTLGGSYTFNNRLGKVNSICLKNYSYIIHSNYANYWAHTMFTELLGQGSFSNFNLFHRFDFQLSGNTEKVSIAKGATIALYSANIKSVDFNVNSI